MTRIAKRKNKDFYDDYEIFDFIKYLLIKYPPVIPKDVITSFKEFIEKFSKLEMTWYEWEALYKTGKSAEEITKEILYPSFKNASLLIAKHPNSQRRRPSLKNKQKLTLDTS